MIWRRWSLVGTSLVAATIVVAIWLGSGTSLRPNILLVTLDTVRADHCSVYGYHRPTTPTLQRVASEGMVFRAAYAPMATTGPSHATIFTSLYPRTHGFVKNGLGLDGRFTTLAEILAANGYQTAAVVASFPVNARFGLDQGFELYDDDFEADGRSLAPRVWEGHLVEEHFDRDGRIVSETAIRWLRETANHERPFFLWAHYFDPHSPYQPAEGYAEIFSPPAADPSSDQALQRTIADYDAEIRETDDAVGRLLHALDRLGLTDSTLLVVAGDHGEGLMQHGHMEHGLHLYEEGVLVPLLFRLPGTLPAGVEIEEPVELLDLAPTILDLAQIPWDPTTSQGTSLAGAMLGTQRLDPDRTIVLQRRHYESTRVGEFLPVGEQLGLRMGKWKYIQAPEEESYELFDLEEDPGEQHNRHADLADVALLMRRTLEHWRDTTPAEDSGKQDVPPEDADRLRQLGYVD